jgi:hypothetical protein
MIGVLTLILGCLPPRPAAPRLDLNKIRADRVKILAPTIQTTMNVFDVQFVADYASDPITKKSANDKVLQLIKQSDSLRDMLLLSARTPGSSHGDDARLQAEHLLTIFRSQGPARITNLLAAVFSSSQYNFSAGRSGRLASLLTTATQTSGSPIASRETMSNLFQTPIEASVIAAAKEIITNAYEQISEDDYSHDFSIEDTSLSPLVAKIKTNNRYSDLDCVDISYSIVQGHGDLRVSPEPLYGSRAPRGNSTLGASTGGFSPTVSLRGFSRDSFKKTGLSYERLRYNSSGIIREIVRRESVSSGRAVSTEVITWNGIHYRKSTIEGF